MQLSGFRSQPKLQMIKKIQKEGSTIHKVSYYI